jgi:hypothetical protein
LALLLALATEVGADSQVRFLLVPKTEYHGEATDPARFLPDGEIRLYRPGEYKPRLIVKPNEPTVLSEGSWLWIAEAPGWVTVEAGALVAVPTASSKSEKRTVVGLLVPACEVTLSDAKNWPGTERVDFVSPTYGVTFPLPIDFRSTVRIPAGRWLAYSVGQRGLIGITKPRSCSAGQELHLKTIAPPGRDREEWMVHVEVPPEVEARREDFQVVARGSLRSSGPPVAAAASLWNGHRGTFFLFDVPAGSDLRLGVEHPLLRTSAREQSVSGARAVEIGPLVLKPRRELVVTVDYRPVRHHAKELLVLLDCGDRPLSLADEIQPRCNERKRTERVLRRGLGEYRFDLLDDGQYRMDAEIDDEAVWGLGDGVIPRLDPATDDPASPLSATLEELHVFGNLLERGKPVPGEIRIFKEKILPLTSYPTDDDHLYHLYYFGYLVTERWFRSEVAARIPAGSRAMPQLRYLSACSFDGRCRAFNSLSAIVGQGRWDIELGDGGTIEFRSTDSSTGSAVPETMVVFQRTPSTFFVDGKVFEYLDPDNFMPNVVSTGPTGRVLVRWPGTEKAWYGAGKDGYADNRGEFQPLPGETVTVEIQLQAEDSQSDGVRVRLRHGEVLPKAFFLVLDDQGVRQSCSRTGSNDGYVSFPPNCLAGRNVIVIHPAAALQILDGDSLRSAAEISVEPAPAKPATVRVMDGDGRPIPDVAFELRFPEVTLTLNDFYFASSLSGQPLGLGRTSGDGRVLLPTVDPRAWGPVEAVIVLGQEEDAVEVELGTESALEVR